TFRRRHTFRDSLRISLPSTPSSSVGRKENVPPKTKEDDCCKEEEDSREGKGKGKRKMRNTTFRKKRKKTDRLIKSLGVRLYPNGAQKALMRRWLGCAKKAYNMVVGVYRKNRCGLTHHNFFRTLLKIQMKMGGWSFMDIAPYEVLDHAITGAIKARDEVIRRNRDNFDNGQPRPPHRLHFQKLKDDKQTITIRAQYCRPHLTFYKR
ncbi:hypothetical protein HK097_006501, partial [Rhizophlyctis rosea]